MRQAPELERMLVASGIHLFKFWFSVSREEQLRRFISRRDDALKHWKLSPWTSSRSTAGTTTPKPKRDVLPHPHRRRALGHHPFGRQKRARLNCIRYFLHQLDYPGKDVKAIGKVDDKIVLVPDTRYKEKTIDVGHD